MTTPSFSKLPPRERFFAKWRAYGFSGSDLKEEFRFHRTRKYRFDFAFPSAKVAVEIDGFGFGHQSIARLSQNHTKDNFATELGWVVLRYTSKQVGTHDAAEEAVLQVCRVLQRRLRP